MLEKLPEMVGLALGVRPGLEGLVINDPALGDIPEEISLTSPAFAEGGQLPIRFTMDGESISPPLHWVGVPENAAELVLLIEDADSPTLNPLVHAIVWRIAPGDGALEEGAMPIETEQVLSPSMGVNSYLRIGYLPPDPPAGHGSHRYAFQIFALAAPLTIETIAPGRTELVDALRVHALAKGLLIATYERS